MALPKYTEDTAIIENLGTNPEDRTDLNDTTFKRKWDENATKLKAWINDILTVAVDNLISTHVGEITAHAETVSRTITVGTGKNFVTITAALASIKKHIPYGVTITITVDAGTYEGGVDVAGFYGAGKLVIHGASSVTNTHKIDRPLVQGCTCEIEITGFYCMSTGVCVEIYNATRIKLQYINSQESAVNGFGIYAMFSSVHIQNCTFSNRNIALLASTNSRIYSESWTSGTGNAIGIKSENNASVGKNGTQPQGTTAEQAVQGGVIR